MENGNLLFLEAFKHLDKLCRELYPVGKGVTSYIEDMKQTSVLFSRQIPGWDSDLEQLVRFRHMRNQLAHEVSTLNVCISTPEDAAWLKAFCRRILNQSDPIAMRYQLQRPARQPSPLPPLAPRNDPNTPEPPGRTDPEPPRHRKTAIGIVLVGAAALLFSYLLFQLIFR